MTQERLAQITKRGIAGHFIMIHVNLLLYLSARQDRTTLEKKCYTEAHPIALRLAALCPHLSISLYLYPNVSANPYLGVEVGEPFTSTAH